MRSSYVYPLLIGSLCIFLSIIPRSDAIQCYQCNSYNDTRCKDTVLPDTMKADCPKQSKDNHPYIMCRKITQVIEFEVNGLPPDTRVIRTCGWDDTSYKNKCYHRSGFGGRQEVCACETDNCNSAPAVVQTLLPLVISFLLLKQFF